MKSKPRLDDGTLSSRAVLWHESSKLTSMSKETLHKANLERLGAPKLSELVMEMVQGSASLQRRARMELSAAQGPKEVAADLEAFLHQQALQHPAAREGELHVQLVDAVHQFQIGFRDRARAVVDAAPANPQHDGLAADAEFGGGIGSPVLSDQWRLRAHYLRSATDPPFRARRTKIILQRRLSDLLMQGFHVDHRFRLSLRGFAE